MNKTNISFKKENPPRTVLERYNKLKKKNKALEILKSTLDLEIKL